jgi:hypothetical protein
MIVLGVVKSGCTGRSLIMNLTRITQTFDDSVVRFVWQTFEFYGRFGENDFIRHYFFAERTAR